MSLSGGIAMFQ